MYIYKIFSPYKAHTKRIYIFFIIHSFLCLSYSLFYFSAHAFFFVSSASCSVTFFEECNILYRTIHREVMYILVVCFGFYRFVEYKYVWWYNKGIGTYIYGRIYILRKIYTKSYHHHKTSSYLSIFLSFVYIV